METHVTEEQQLVAIKEWWKANGSSIITGVILGFAVLFATRAWFAWQKQKAHSASDLFITLESAVQRGNDTVAEERAGNLIADYSSTTYADFAALALARIRIEDRQYDAAATQLQWVIDHGREAFVRDVARMRLARVKLAQGDIKAARTALGQAGQAGAGKVLRGELLGDIDLADGNRDAAKQAYGEALAAADKNYPGRSLLQLKYDNVADGGSSQ
jgi:predicted negative regulator of RcsB-dependent stress response